MAERILIDCGASTGSAIAELSRLFGPFDRVLAIEPNPENSCQITGCAPGAEVVEAAVYTRDGRMKLYLGEQFDGSTLYVDKMSGGIRADRFTDVETLDFSRWLNSTVSKEDYVVCKMDVEGAEFDVLEHLVRTGRTRLLNLLLVEWHVSRFPDRWPRRFRRLLIKLRFFLAGVQVKSWR